VDLRRYRHRGYAFIAAAFDVLTDEHVIPTPIFNPLVAVGRDHFGDSIRAGLAW